MSLVAQMQRDREHGSTGNASDDLPLFAAADAIAAGRRKRGSLLLALPAVLVPVLLIAAPVLLSKHLAAPGGLQATAAAVDHSMHQMSSMPTGKRRDIAASLNAPGGAAMASADPGNAGNAIAAAQTAGNDASAVTTAGNLNSAIAEPKAKDNEPVAEAASSAAQAAVVPGKVQRQVQKKVQQVAADAPEARQTGPARQRIEVAAKLRATPRQAQPSGAAHARADVRDFKRVAPLDAAQRDQLLSGQAQELLDNDAFDMARRTLQSGLGSSIELPQSAALLATLLIAAQEFTAAEALLADHLAAHPGSATLRVAKLRLLLARGEFEAVLQYIRSLPPSMQDRVDIMEMQAVGLRSLQEFDAAGHVYRQLLARNDTNPRWWMGLAVALDATAQLDGARQAYIRALELRGLGAQSAQYARQRLAQL